MSNTKSNTNQHGNSELKSELKDEEVIKALECCVDYTIPCQECPLRKQRNCIDNVKKNVLDLINRQKAEIERLRNILKNGCELSRCINKGWIQSEAIKEFWEKLKETRQWDDDIPEYVFTASGDNLLKEMIKELI